jgi:hypothetical protein
MSLGNVYRKLLELKGVVNDVSMKIDILQTEIGRMMVETQRQEPKIKNIVETAAMFMDPSQSQAQDDDFIGLVSVQAIMKCGVGPFENMEKARLNKLKPKSRSGKCQTAVTFNHTRFPFAVLIANEAMPKRHKDTSGDIFYKAGEIRRLLRYIQDHPPPPRSRPRRRRFRMQAVS